ncbi:3-oxoacyl-ACP synthase [Lacinutrix sp. C3R15]|uniref:3-oxoacyl-ACP synthase n=1 Tax=Flavobacteriaceae TaxID=49546 RepID=UPI001C08DE5F|nr:MULTISPECIES: 3-oxoacyl-ACP synthase [Flavobacteriaceae]MBU2938203.1 3-oxoacyl-ACP synthase [Lacinutrix sp. C3R15]MDO6621517.1 3-oxoacyl-ACP synthase [Oceanihabitans sp. 1_MG-2023]
MNTNYHIKSFCSIKNNQVSLNGSVVYKDEENSFSQFIKAAYKQQNSKYPKFFKMDNLSKLAFLAADILLKNENLSKEKENNIAIVFSNKSSSLDTDRKHQESIQNKESYFPSPAVFVYTLPNICIGEISIKYKLYSENSFFIFDSFNATHLLTYTNSLLSSNKANQVLCGWVEFDDENNYQAFLYLVSTKGTTKHNKQDIIKLYNT